MKDFNSTQGSDKPSCIAPAVENIPEAMRAESRWVCWQYEWNGSKWTKVPINALTRHKASTTNSTTWATFDDAVAAYQRGGVDGIGFVLGDGWAGIDLDDHLDGDGRLTPFAEHVLQRFKSYHEVSPSGEGVKILIRASIKHGHADHKAGIEVYGSGRYFTVTGQRLSDSPTNVEDRQSELSDLLNQVRPKHETKIPAWAGLTDVEKALAAIKHLSPSRSEGYQDWLAVGMALRAVSPALLAEWDRWSAQSPKHDEQCCSRAWASFGRSGYSIASLIYWADQDSPGWRDQYRTSGAQAAPQAAGEASSSTSCDEFLIPVDVAADAWPAPPSDAAFHGLASEFVELIEPHSEADRMALLLQFLAALGNVIGRSAHFMAEGHRHFLNLFVALVGNTSKGRKGSSLSHVLRVLRMIDEPWTENGVGSGLSSGEGLIWQVHDPILERQPIKDKGRVVDYQDVIVDPGISDKRQLVVEEEFARVLAVMGRDSNTLSAVLRQAWDSGILRTMTKNSPAKATGAHVSVVGHVTRDELRRGMTNTERTNGFANRFLWSCVRRSKSLPEGGRIHEVDLAPLVSRLRQAVTFASGVSLLDRDEQARARWHQVYDSLSAGKPGMFGAVTARAEAQVMRLACLYALLDSSIVIRLEHLEAALAVWDYCERSAAYIFSDSLGNKLADDLLMTIRACGVAGMSRTEMRDMSGRNRNGADIARALRELATLDLIERIPPEPGKIGKPVERWRAKSQNDQTTKPAA